MKQTLILATNNANKVLEIKSVVGDLIDIISLQEAGIFIEIPEPHNSLEENANEKSKTIYQLTHQNCFAEDTGLEVEALNGEPGVRSARYAGEEKGANENIALLLKNLDKFENRNAQFRTVISLIFNDQTYQFEGICKGAISKEKKGTEGFGYDPIFIPEGANSCFAEMSLAEKNLFSHRKKAVNQLIDFLITHCYAKNKN